MHVLLEGLSQSLPYLPTLSADVEAGRIRHPGYED